MPHADGSPGRGPLSEEARIARATRMKEKRLKLEVELAAASNISTGPVKGDVKEEKGKSKKKRPAEKELVAIVAKDEEKEKPASAAAVKKVTTKKVKIANPLTPTEEFLSVLTNLLATVARDGEKILQISLCDSEASEWTPSDD